MFLLKHLYFIIASTFIVGFLTGVYIYIISSAEVNTPSGPQAPQRLVIVADMYGGCEMLGACPSYRIERSGTYTYLHSAPDGDVGRYDGALTDRQLDTLTDTLADVDLSDVERSQFNGTCPIAFDGAAFTYEIQYRGIAYTIDTCAQETGDEPLFTLLEEYFALFSATHLDTQ